MRMDWCTVLVWVKTCENSCRLDIYLCVEQEDWWWSQVLTLSRSPMDPLENIIGWWVGAMCVIWGMWWWGDLWYVHNYITFNMYVFIHSRFACYVHRFVPKQKKSRDSIILTHSSDSFFFFFSFIQHQSTSCNPNEVRMKEDWNWKHVMTWSD
jgi:hypothetical protein